MSDLYCGFTKEQILAATDHTVLSTTAVLSDILRICDEGVKYATASVCIPSCYVADAVKHLKGRLPVCTVIGFPNGYSTKESKVFEAQKAVADSALEIDTVINVGMLKDGRYDEILDELKAIKAACGDKILKVIVETCLLTQEEKVKICKIVMESGADFIKTSTGFPKAEPPLRT